MARAAAAGDLEALGKIFRPHLNRIIGILDAVGGFLINHIVGRFAGLHRVAAQPLGFLHHHGLNHGCESRDPVFGGVAVDGFPVVAHLPGQMSAVEPIAVQNLAEQSGAGGDGAGGHEDERDEHEDQTAVAPTAIFFCSFSAVQKRCSFIRFLIHAYLWHG